MTAFELLERNTLLSDEQKDRSIVVVHRTCARNTPMKIIISRTHLSEEAFFLPPLTCQASARHIRPFVLDASAIRGNNSIARLLILIGQIQNERERHCIGSFVELIIFIAFRSFSSSPFSMITEHPYLLSSKQDTFAVGVCLRDTWKASFSLDIHRQTSDER